MTVAAILLGIGALGGVVLLALRLRGGNPPFELAAVHGIVAATGLGFLAFAVADGARPMALASLAVLVPAAAIGVWLASRHAKGHLIPIGVALGHAVLAVVGYSLLLASLFDGP